MIYVLFDTETRSSEDLKKRGLLNYINSPDFTLLIAHFRVYDSEKRGVLYQYTWDCENHCEADLIAQLVHLSGQVFIAHNATFDREAIKKHTNIRLNTLDTLDIAGYYGLPVAALDKLAQALSIGVRKDTRGTRLKTKFTTINKRTGGFNEPADSPDDWKAFIEYCEQDVEVLQQIVMTLPVDDFIGNNRSTDYCRTQTEIDFYKATHAMKHLPIDISTLKVMQTTKDRLIKAKTEEIERACGVDGILTSPIKLKTFLQDNGIDVDSTDKGHLEELLYTLPDGIVKDVVSARLLIGKSSLKKIDVALSNLYDGGLHNLIRYCGASSTGRDAGRVFQPQNIPRLSGDYEQCLVKCYSGIAETEDLHSISNSLRAIIKAEKGMEFVGADYSQIESRVLAWIANEEWKLNFYKNTASEYDVYQMTYAEAFNIHPSEVTKDLRQIGKAMELSLGYGGGAVAFINTILKGGADINKLKDTALMYKSTELGEKAAEVVEYLHKDKDDADLYYAAEYMKLKWRDTNKATVALWDRLNNAFIKAFVVKAKVELRNISFGYGLNRTLPEHMVITLPSSRRLFLYYPQVDYNTGNITVGYTDSDSSVKTLARQHIYGGALAARITQATARDLLAFAVSKIYKKYDIVLRVHDELVLQVKKGKLSYADLEKMMCELPDWGAGIPIKASGWADSRYTK